MSLSSSTDEFCRSPVWSGTSQLTPPSLFVRHVSKMLRSVTMTGQDPRETSPSRFSERPSTSDFPTSKTHAPHWCVSTFASTKLWITHATCANISFRDALVNFTMDFSQTGCAVPAMMNWNCFIQSFIMSLAAVHADFIVSATSAYNEMHECCSPDGKTFLSRWRQ